MKRLLGLTVGCLVAACAGSSEGTPSNSATTADDELNILELKCRNGERVSRTRFDVQPGLAGSLQGVLETNEGLAALVCHPSHVLGEDGLPSLLISCVEAEKEEPRPMGRWTVEVRTEPDGRQQARIDRNPAIVGEGPEIGEPSIVVGEELACARIARSVPLLPYSVISSYINQTCNVCHSGRFDSLEKVRAERDIMLGMISSGIMPKRNPAWRTSDEGRLTIQFLANSPELLE